MQKLPTLKRLLIAVAIGAAVAVVPVHKALSIVSNPATETTTALGNGVTTDYTIGFTFLAQSDVHVYLQSEAVSPFTRTEVLQGSGASKFTITGTSPGTTVHMGTAPTSTQRLIIKRQSPLTQTVNYVETQAFPAVSHEKQMDKQILLLQELGAELDSKIGLSDTSTGTAPTIPDPSADKFLVYNHGGTDLTIAPTGAPTSGDILKFSGTAWTPYALGTDLSTFAAHIANTSNPHSVTAAQVGNGTAQWNANKIQGKTVDATAIANGYALTYSLSGDKLIYSPPSTPALTSAHLFVGNGSNTAMDVALIGDATLANTGALTVATVGGSTAANINTAEALANAATATNTNNTIVKRNGSGAAALNVTGNLTGSVTGNVTGNVSGTAATFTGNLTGDVTSTGMTTSVSNLTRSKLAAGSINQVVINDGSGNLTSEATLAKTRGGTAQDNSSLTFPSTGTVPAYTPTNHGVVISGSGAAAVVTSAGTSLQVLTSNGPSADPTFQTAPVSTTLTTKGDVQTFSTVNARQPVPGDYGMLLPDSAQTTGWRNADYLTRIRGDSQKNYIQYNDFENGATTGWSLGHVTLTNGIPTGTPTFGSGASGNLSVSANNTTPISGGFSGLMNSSAATTVGDFVSTSALPIDVKGRAKSLQFKVDYAVSNGGNGNFSGTTSNTYGYAVYDVTNSAWLSCTGQFNFVSNVVVGSGSYPAGGNCQTNSNTASVRVVVYNVAASAGLITLQFDDAYFGPQITAAGAAITDLSLTNPVTPAAAAFGTISNNKIYTARRGDVLVVSGTFQNGTVAASTALMTIPFNIDTAKIASATNAQIVGYFSATQATSATAMGSSSSGYLFFDGTNLNQLFFAYQTGTATQQWNKVNASTLFAAGNQIVSVYAEVPISGWSSNTVMSNDTASNIISFKGQTSVATSLTAATFVQIPFATITYDDVSGWSTNQYTAQATGRYKIAANIATGTVAWSVNQGLLLAVYKNGSADTIIGEWVSQGSFSSTAKVGGSTEINLVAGDVISLRCQSDVTVALNGVANRNNITIERLSGPATIAAADTVAARYFASATAISGTLATVVWTTKDFDTTNSMSSGVYTCPISGKYQVNSNIQTGGTIALNSSVDLQLQKNTVAVSEFQTFAGGAMTSQNGQLSDTVQCLGGDQLRIQVSSSATAPSITVSNTKVFFSISRVGN